MVEYGLRVVSAHDRLSQKAGVSIMRRVVQSRGLGYEYMYEVSQERTNRTIGISWNCYTAEWWQCWCVNTISR